MWQVTLTVLHGDLKERLSEEVTLSSAEWNGKFDHPNVRGRKFQAQETAGAKVSFSWLAGTSPFWFEICATVLQHCLFLPCFVVFLGTYDHSYTKSSLKATSIVGPAECPFWGFTYFLIYSSSSIKQKALGGWKDNQWLVILMGGWRDQRMTGNAHGHF